MTLSPSREETAQQALADRLNDPAVANALSSLLDHADLLALLVVGLDGFIARTEVIGDNLVDGIDELRGAAQNEERASGLDVQALAEAGKSLARSLPKAAPGIAAAVESGALEKLVASGVLGEESIDQVALLGRGLARGAGAYATRPVEVGGTLSLLRLLKDPDISRAISYFATVAKSIGQELGAAPTNRPTR